ncbi:MAG: hypothetical protein SCALA701_02440 [Candidatus Scalindua sp.]|nr:NAD-dependent epimerase/dehydratase family protein [Planctomycetota bacterium]GJQ57443.1 MAG: hypothetical protein SCALA701_02440 [Candidatus Scalindua sp.]
MVSKENNRSFKVGVIGCGRVAEHHLKFLLQTKCVEIVGLVDNNIGQARQLGEKYGITKTFSSMDELVEFCHVDVLHITTPPLYHYEQALKAINKGIHVLIEKPIALSFEDTRKLYELAEEKNVKICPDYIHLFNPLVLKVNSAIKQNNLGQLIHAEAYWSMDLNIPELVESIGLHWSYELPGGVMQNYITHLLYLVFSWTGESQKITTYSRQLGSIPQGLTDHIDVLIDGKEATGKITLTFFPKQANYYLKLFFDRGTATIDFITQTYTFEKVNSLPRTLNRVLINFMRSRQLVGGSIQNIIGVLRKKMVPYHGLQFLIESFYGCIEGENSLPVSKELALDVSKAEENILEHAGKVHFDNSRRPSTQAGITKSEKILITGGTGYLGSEIVRQLIDAGYYVRAYVRKSSHTASLEDLGVELFYGDTRELELLREAAQGMDIIIHAAAGMKGSLDYMVDSCVKGTENIAEAASQAKVKKVIYISSFGIYEYLQTKNGTILHEDSQLETMPEKRGFYSLAKRRAEDIALSHLTSDGPAWIVLRPSRIFGNGSDLVSLVGPKIGKLVISFGRKGKHLKLIHVKDVAKAVLLSLENDSTDNRVFNISHNDQITVRELVQKCFKKSHLEKYRIIHFPYSAGLITLLMIKILKVILGKGPSMNKSRLAYVCRDLLADSQKIRNTTGWNPSDSLLKQLMSEVERT